MYSKIISTRISDEVASSKPLTDIPPLTGPAGVVHLEQALRVLEEKARSLDAEERDENQLLEARRHYYYQRLCILENIDSKAKEQEDIDNLFLALPLDMKIEFLLTKRNIKTEAVTAKTAKEKRIWYDRLTAAMPEEFAKLIAINVIDTLNARAKAWIGTNAEKLTRAIEESEESIAVLRNTPEYKAAAMYNMLACGLRPEYIETFGFTASEVKHLARPYGKYKIALFFRLLGGDHDLSVSECKELALRYTQTYKDVLREIDTIQRENPDLSSHDCKRLGIHNFKKWRERLALLPAIEKEGMRLLTEHLGQQAAESKTLSPTDCKRLTIHSPNNFRDTILTMIDAQKKCSGLSWDHCKKLVFRNSRNWQKKLESIPAIKAMAVNIFKTYGLDDTRSLSNQDCMNLLLHHSDIGNKLNEIARFHLDNPGLSWSMCKEIMIRMAEKGGNVLRLAETIAAKATGITGTDRNGTPRTVSKSDSMYLAVNAAESWQDALLKAVSIHDQYPQLSWAACKSLAIRYGRAWPDRINDALTLHADNRWIELPTCLWLILHYGDYCQSVIDRCNALRSDSFWKRHYSDFSLIAISRDNGSLARNMEQIKHSFDTNGSMIRNKISSDDATWGERETNQLIMAYTILNLAIPSGQLDRVLESGGNFDNLTMFTHLAADKYGNLANLLIRRIGYLETVDERETGFADGRPTLIEESIESRIIRQEKRAAWQNEAKKLLAPEEFQALYAFVHNESCKQDMLNAALLKLRGCEAMREALISAMN